MATPSVASVAPSSDDIEAVIQMATSNRQSPDSRSSIPLKDTRTQLFVGNLPYRVRWQDLKDLFRRAGTVLRADVSLGPDNRSRGYGTVLLATAEDAGRAIDMLNGYCWQTRVLEVRPDRLGTMTDFDNGTAPYVPSGSAYPSVYDEYAYGAPDAGAGMRNLFVGNLPFHIQWQDLKDLFRAAGAVVRADVALGPDGRSRGFGTVSYASEEGAERGRRMFDGYEFNGRPLKVHYDKFSQSAQPVPLSVTIPQSGVSHLDYAQYDTPAPHTHLDSLASKSHMESMALDPMSQLDALTQRSALDSLGHHQHAETLAQRSDLLAERLHLDGYRQTASTQYHPPTLDHSKSDPLVRSHYVELSSSQSHSQSQSQNHSPLTQDLFTQSHLDSLARSQLESLTQRQLESLAQRQLESLTQRQLDSLTSSQLEALILHSQSQSLPHSQSRSSHSQSQTHSNSLVPTPNHSLSHAGSLSSSPHPTQSSTFGSSPHSATFSSTANITSSPRPTRGLKLNLTTNTSNVGVDHTSPRPSFSVPTSQAVSPQQRGLASFSAGAEQRGSFSGDRSEPFNATSSARPSFSAGASQRPSFSASTSQRPSFSAGASQRPSFSASSSARPSFSAGTAQRPSFGAGVLNGTSSLLSGPFLDDPPSSNLSLSSNTSSSIPPSSRTASRQLLNASPPPTGGWPTLGISRDVASKDIAQSILSDRQSSDQKRMPDASSVWSGGKGTGSEVDYVTSALGALGMRRASRVTSPSVQEDRVDKNKDTDKDKSTRQQSQWKSPPRTRVASAQARPQTQSQSHPAHPGPIALPPPSPFAIPMLSPHYTVHSPLHHPYYVGQHPQSPMYHPGTGHAGSPLHHPGHTHHLGSPHPHMAASPHPHMAGSPLHHPGHGYHHPLHYGVMTPHGLPPITPSMPPFTFLHPSQRQTNGNSNTGSNGNGNRSSPESNGSNEIQQPQQPQHPAPTTPLYYPQPQSQHPQYQQHPHPHVHFHHPQMFSPGIPLSPGLMIPVSMVPMTPGGVPMTPSGMVPVPMTPGVAMTPGVRAFWPNAPWINPVVGAPVRVDEEREGSGGGGSGSGGGGGESEGYFPPVFGGSTSSGQGSGGVRSEEMGYFPPVSIANEILKEGSGFGVREREDEAERKKSRKESPNSAHSGSRSSRSPSTSAWMTSPSPDKEDEDGGGVKEQGVVQEKFGLARAASQSEGKKEHHDGTSKRGSLTHRPESDPIVR